MGTGNIRNPQSSELSTPRGGQRFTICMKVGFVSSDENATLQVDHLSCHPESKNVKKFSKLQ